MSRKNDIRDELKTIFTEEIEVEAKYPDGSDVPVEVAEGVTQRQLKALALQTEYQTIVKGEESRKGLSDMRDWLEKPASGIVFPNGQTDGKDGGHRESKAERKSPGELFIADQRWMDYLDGIKVNGHVPDGQSIKSPPIQYKSLVTGVGSTSAGAFTIPDQQPFVQLGRRPLVIRDIITIGQTGTDTVEFVRTLAETNNAATVAEATAASGSSGVKPESSLTFERVTEAVKTIAHWLPVTNRALSDAGQMRTLIDSFLLDGLMQTMEDQIVTGDGAGENFTGITNLSGHQSQAWDTDIFTTARRARTKVRVIGRATPTAYLMNPYDVEKVDLTQDNEGRFYYGGPAADSGNSRLWRLPIVESEACPEGTAFVGDFKTCVLWDREQGSIAVSDSHADMFIRNMVAIRAELRAAFGCLRPAAIVEMDISPAA